MDFQKLIFVSGKGGTGKTTVALLLARHLSQQGKKVLFVELAARSSARHLTGVARDPEYKPTPSGFGFDWALLQGLDCLIEYIGSFTIEKLAQQFLSNQLMRTLLNVAPGLSDLAILGKLTSSMRQHGPGFHYDHIVVDAPSTGSFASLLSAPQILGASVSTGPLHSQSLQIDHYLHDPKSVQYLFVGLFEELPMDELEETIAGFRKSFPEQFTVVMNKKLMVEDPKIPETNWQTFVRAKIKEQESISKRVLAISLQSYFVPFYTEEFTSVLTQNQGDFLREPLTQ